MSNENSEEVHEEAGLIRALTLNAYQVAHTIIVSGFNGSYDPEKDIVHFTYNGKNLSVNFENLVTTLGILPARFESLYQHNGDGWVGFIPGGKQDLANLLGKTIVFIKDGTSETYSPK
ncbi:MAG: hypothetical protein KGH55_02635 [Nanoarchaeota archaeon]|nr:hypothetical protein [Nanoarchaeota archaeon]